MSCCDFLQVAKIYDLYNQSGKELWWRMGCDTLPTMTTGLDWKKYIEQKIMLRVDLVSYTKGHRYALYNVFKVGSSSTYYTLTTNSYSGNAGNSLQYSNGMKFTTKDRDNDKWPKNCAGHHSGGWWYKSCTNAALNGIFASSNVKY